MAEKKLDEKTKKSLLGLMPFTQSGSIWFTPEVFEGTGPSRKYKPKFKQRAFNRQEIIDIREAVTAGTISDIIVDFARRTVLDWKSVYDLAIEKQIVFKANGDGGADGEVFDLLPEHIAASLFSNARQMSGMLTEEEQGLK